MNFMLERARPFVGLVVNRKVKLSRSQRKIWSRDSDLRDAVTVLAGERYLAAPDGFGAGEDEDEESGLIRFLNWLIEHQDEIKALIEMIMAMFAGNEDKSNVV